jgi:SAM-dependent methyltransferase
MRYYDDANKRIVFEEKKADESFWDDQWRDDNLKSFVEAGRRDLFVSRFTKKFLKPGKDVRILEGGCGKGRYVYALASRGYDAYGIDYAPEIIRKLNSTFPELKISFGDVRKIEFPDGYFDGYWSLGVIEHFYDGYDTILEEMARVLKPGGYPFLTFPYMSPLRRLKAGFGRYPAFDSETFRQDNFYQFALDHQKVLQSLERLGFEQACIKPLDGIKGLKDDLDIPFFKGAIGKIYHAKGFLMKLVRMFIYVVSSPFSGHIVLLILKKKHD